MWFEKPVDRHNMLLHDNVALASAIANVKAAAHLFRHAKANSTNKESQRQKYVLLEMVTSCWTDLKDYADIKNKRIHSLVGSLDAHTMEEAEELHKQGMRYVPNSNRSSTGPHFKVISKSGRSRRVGTGTKSGKHSMSVYTDQDDYDDEKLVRRAVKMTQRRNQAAKKGRNDRKAGRSQLAEDRASSKAYLKQQVAQAKGVY